MKTMSFDAFGGPEVLRASDAPVPEPGPGQVRVRVRAAGLNPLDAKIRSGGMQQVMPTALPAVLGQEVAGTVDAVGPGVQDLAVGDEVLGFADTGGYAEQALVTTAALKPPSLGWAEAAALPVAAETALRVLRQLEVADGETLLVHGAAGAVGTLVVQMAVARGARVVGTASEANHAHLRALGATAVTYGDGLVERVRAAAPEGVDAVLDAAGRGALPDSIALRRGTSRIVTIADPAAFGLGVAFSDRAERDAGALAEVARSAAEGLLVVTVSRTYPLEDAGRAHADLETGHARGKSVLLVDGGA